MRAAGRLARFAFVWNRPPAWGRPRSLGLGWRAPRCYIAPSSEDRHEPRSLAPASEEPPGVGQAAELRPRDGRERRRVGKKRRQGDDALSARAERLPFTQ